jgi:hypothetical protein
MDLGNIWTVYCEDRLGSAIETARPVPVTPWRGIELTWTWHPMFVAKFDVLQDVPYSTAFDEEADIALMALAMRNSFDAMDGTSAGAWRVLYERLSYTQVVMLANEAAKKPVISRLPEGLSETEQAIAIGLQFLLGGARTIDRRLLPKSKPGKLPPFPASTSLRRQ